jgi:cytochrome d ubiquinol oxidase subunit II
MGLEILWFCLIAVLWAGYFVLEGFDFGVGLLLPVLPRDEDERSAMFESIGPVWDGNEVWLVVAGAATFAAFPVWYGTMFSAFYLALLLVLVCLIVRVVSFEWRGKSDDPRWRSAWQWANTIGSGVAAFVWGVALSDLLHGIPLDSNGDYAGSFWDLFSAYSVFAGLVVVLLFAFHGASYLTLRTGGDLRVRATAAARRLALPAAAAGIAFLAWTLVVAHDNNQRDLIGPVWPALFGALALVLAAMFALVGRNGRTFLMTAAATAAFVATLFTALYPRVLVSSTDFANSLTLSNSAAGHYALEVITVVAAILAPVVLLYQGWTYYVFRARVGGFHADGVMSPAGGASTLGRPPDERHT